MPEVREISPFTVLLRLEVRRPSPARPIVIIGSSPGTVSMETSAPSTMTRPRKALVGEDQDPATRARAKEKNEGKTRVVPQAQGDLEQEMVHPEDEEAIALRALVGQLLPPTGNKYEEPPRVAKRIAKFAPSI